ncbi:MAG TPA: hypothetical protein VE860_18920, partial [Chthoniobacterales bacterium]|nr:hypothetical protein [Chthoniobacterales bacterium]
LKPPSIPGLTELLSELNAAEQRTIVARLRRARLLAPEDPHEPSHLDAHPLVREYFGEQLRSQRTAAWKECNRRLFYHYQSLAPQLPESFRDMEPLVLAVICGCNASLYHEALNKVYIPRIQRGETFFAARVLGARETLLLILAHFFEQGRWSFPLKMGAEGQSLTAEDQLFILMQAGFYLTATRGYGAYEAEVCFKRVESLSNSLGRPIPHSALIGQWRYSLVTEKLSTTLRIAKRIYSLAQEQNDTALMMGAYRALSATLFFLGDFEFAREYAMRGLQIWRTRGAEYQPEEITAHPVAYLYYEALCEWHFGEFASSQANTAEAISLAKELNDIHGLAVSLFFAGILAQCERDHAKLELLASNMIELSTRQNFALWLAGGVALRGWARSVSGHAAEGISCIEDGIKEFRATGATLTIPFFLALKAEALHMSDRTFEALEATNEAEALAERAEERWWCAEIYRLRGVFLAALDAEETQIQASFREAIRIAKEQKSVSLQKRAEATYAEYHRQKATGLAGRGFRVPLC